MKRPLFTTLLFLFLSHLALQAAPPRKEARLMTQIARHIKDMEVVRFPAKGERWVNRDWRRYEQKKKWVKRDMAELLKINPRAASSRHSIWGKSFNSYVAHGKKLMKLNDAAGAAFFGKRSANPNEENAIKKIDFALLMAKQGIRILKKERPSYNQLRRQYESYVKTKAEAIALDPSVASFRKKQIAKAAKEFEQPFLVIKAAKDAQIAAADQKRLEERKAKEKAAQEQREANWKAMQTVAEKAGFKKGPFDGLWSFVKILGQGDITKEDGRKHLIFLNGQDDYEVQSLDGKFVFFIDLEDENLSQIAIIKEEGKIYLEGHDLPDGEYAFINIGTFTTVAGAEKQIPVFRHVPRK